MYKFFIIGLVIAAAAALPMQEAGVVQDVKHLDCLEGDEDIFSCLAVKAATSLSRAARSSDIKVFDGVTFVKEADVPVERSGKTLVTETEILNELPRDATDRTMKLATMLFESVMSFFKTHSLKFSMPEGSISRALVEDVFSSARRGGGGGGKMKKMMLPLLIAAGVKIFALVPILLGGLGLLVLKAVVVSKIALILAGVLLFQKLFGAGGSGFGSSGLGGAAGSFFSKNSQSSWDSQAPQAWNAGASAQPQGYYKRSFDEAAKVDAHSLAYAAQAPVTNETN